MTEAFADQRRLSGIGGFEPAGFWFKFVAPFRRWGSDAAWFQPIVRVGRGTGAELPLQGPRYLSSAIAQTEHGTGVVHELTPPMPPASTRALSMQFIAPQTGEMFVYVNDLLPFGLGADRFYRDNKGRAHVTLKRFP
jgi:hypothetical protein